jgi:hypothetical protein
MRGGAMEEFDLLKILRDSYKERGPEGVLPPNLPDALVEAIALRGPKEDDSMRKGLVAAAVSLIMFGDTRVLAHAEDIEFCQAIYPYWLNVILENRERTHWLIGYIHPTLKDIFNLDRVALRAGTLELKVSQAIMADTATAIARDPSKGYDEGGSSKDSLARITCVVDEPYLDVLKEIEDYFVANVRAAKYFPYGYRILEPVELDGVKCWRFIWDECHVLATRREFKMQVMRWSEKNRDHIISLDFEIRGLTVPAKVEFRRSK